MKGGEVKEGKGGEEAIDKRKRGKGEDEEGK